MDLGRSWLLARVAHVSLETHRDRVVSHPRACDERLAPARLQKTEAMAGFDAEAMTGRLMMRLIRIASVNGPRSTRIKTTRSTRVFSEDVCCAIEANHGGAGPDPRVNVPLRHSSRGPARNEHARRTRTGARRALVAGSVSSDRHVAEAHLVATGPSCYFPEVAFAIASPSSVAVRTARSAMLVMEVASFDISVA